MNKPCYFQSKHPIQECQTDCHVSNSREKWETCYWGNITAGKEEEENKAKLAKAREIGNDIIKSLYGIEPTDKANHIKALRISLVKIIKKHL